MTIILTRISQFSCYGRLLLVFMLLVSQPSVAQFHGTIFTSPEERAYLDALREDFLKKSQEKGFDIEQAGPPPLPVTADEPTENSAPIEYTLGGILTRNDGSHTVWLNNQPVAERNLPANMKLVTEGALTVLRLQTAAGTFQLKPGQTLNASTGETQEAYQRVVPLVNKSEVLSTAGDAESGITSTQPTPDNNAEAPDTSSEADTRETP